MKTIDMIKTGENIKERCEKADLSPKDLSRALDLDISTIYYWYQGKTLPRFDIAYTLAEMCGCKIDDFIIPIKEETNGEEEVDGNS